MQTKLVALCAAAAAAALFWGRVRPYDHSKVINRIHSITSALEVSKGRESKHKLCKELVACFAENRRFIAQHPKFSKVVVRKLVEFNRFLMNDEGENNSENLSLCAKIDSCTQRLFGMAVADMSDAHTYHVVGNFGAVTCACES